MIRISNCEDRDAPANLDRTITISGNCESVALAQYLINMRSVMGKILSALSSSLSFTPFLSPYFLFLCPFSHISSILDSIHLWMFVISLKLSTLLTVRLLKNTTLVSMNSTNRHLCIKNRRYALPLSQSHYDIRVCFLCLTKCIHLTPQTKFALFWTRSAGSRLGTNWTKNFSIELHKANLLGLEVQYYPYHPAPLSPFPGPSLASLPKLPAQMWPLQGGHGQASSAPPTSSSSSAGAASTVVQPLSVSLWGAVWAPHECKTRPLERSVP